MAASNLQFAGERHRVPMTELTGRANHRVRAARSGEHLIATRLAAGGGHSPRGGWTYASAASTHDQPLIRSSRTAVSTRSPLWTFYLLV